jgi:hypothetical protein
MKDKEYMDNFDRKTSCKAANMKANKDMGTNIKMHLEKQWKVSGSGQGSCPKAEFGIGSTEYVGFTKRKL